MILHTINKSPSENSTFQSCVQLALPGSGILLLENGVYGAVANQANTALLEGLFQTHKIYALEADVKARGLVGKLFPAIELVSYAEFVELSLQFSKVQSWF